MWSWPKKRSGKLRKQRLNVSLDPVSMTRCPFRVRRFEIEHHEMVWLIQVMWRTEAPLCVLSVNLCVCACVCVFINGGFLFGWMSCCPKMAECLYLCVCVCVWKGFKGFECVFEHVSIPIGFAQVGAVLDGLLSDHSCMLSLLHSTAFHISVEKEIMSAYSKWP